MGLKQLIKEQKFLASGAVDMELELPGEPMIYSVKLDIARRKYTIQFFRNEKWRSLLKCYFRSYFKTTTPVVLVIRFYVSPPSYVQVSARDLRSEAIPAVRSFELCDYLLSFLEMLHHVLINSYRQFAKIDAEKYYSDNPRTIFKFMKWDHYVKLKDRDSSNSKAQGLGASKQARGGVQPKRYRHEAGTGACKEIHPGEPGEGVVPTFEGPSSGDSTLQDTSANQNNGAKKKKTTSSSPRNKTGRRQSRKVSE